MQLVVPGMCAELLGSIILEGHKINTLEEWNDILIFGRLNAGWINFC